MKLIMAMAKDNIIGYKGGMPWPFSNQDMARFSALTKSGNGKVIMGRKTWETLPKKFRPLPKRDNIIITRDTGYKAPGGRVYNDVDKCFEENPDSWIIGGAEIYRLAMPLVNEMHISYMTANCIGDTYMPIDYEGFSVEGVDVYQDHVYIRYKK